MALRFRAQGKHFENGAFRKRWRHGDRLISLNEASSNRHKSKMTGDSCVFKSPRRSADGKYLMRRVKSPF